MPKTLYTLACLLLSTGIFAQDQSQEQIMTFTKKMASFADLEKAVLQQTSFTFVYSDAILSKLKPVSIHAIRKPLREVLDTFFSQQPYNYLISENIITIPAVPVVRNRLQPALTHLVKGITQTEDGQPLEGVTIVIKGRRQPTISGTDGSFELYNVHPDDTLVFSYVNKETITLLAGNATYMQVTLLVNPSSMPGVDVTAISNGYQKQSLRFSTGSFVFINNKDFNRQVSASVTDRILYNTSGLLAIANANADANQPTMQLRARSTIFADPAIQVILDNFPYYGNLNNINPNDVESITVLKDAAAASVWGTRTGNGVLVITTKQAKDSGRLHVSVASQLSITEKPDLYYLPRLPSQEYVEAETALFNSGYYNSRLNSPEFTVVSPVVEILNQQKKGTLRPEAAKQQLDFYRNYDNRKDLERYFYRTSLQQQHAVSISGNYGHHAYYASIGYNYQPGLVVNSNNDRLTLNVRDRLRLLPKLEITGGAMYTKSRIQNNDLLPTLMYPYVPLADAYGNATVFPADRRQFYKDSVTNAEITLDWNYRPLDEVKLRNDITNIHHLLMNAGITYTPFRWLDLQVLYQRTTEKVDNENLQRLETYYTRNLINKFTQYNNGIITRPVPVGDIRDTKNTSYRSNNFRAQAQVNFTRGRHAVNGVAGTEVTIQEAGIEALRMYGIPGNNRVNYTGNLPLLYSPFTTQQIPLPNFNIDSFNRFVSQYATAAYTFNRRYTMTGTVRRDASNIFGVDANQKSLLIYSGGLSWLLSEEKFFHNSWLPYLKTRVSYGRTGNIDRSVSAYITAIRNNANQFGVTTSTIVNPANPDLRWELNNTLNLGIDFATRQQRFSGSIEYYSRKGKYLLGYIPLDPTSGYTIQKGNVANMSGKGTDITLKTINLNKQLVWTTTFLFSYAADEVTKYSVKQNSVWYYCNPYFISPEPGRPLYSLYSLPSGPLDPLTGDPQGYLKGHLSKNYQAIFNSDSLATLQYEGPATPRYFGSLLNSLRWKKLELSVNITFKMGYYFRRNSVRYSGFMNYGDQLHADFSKRWQKPGDEAITTVPSMPLQADSWRDDFYTYSHVLIEKGDHIRLQDIKLNYFIEWPKKKKSMPYTLQTYLHVGNIGLLWKATRYDVDPDYLFATPRPLTITVGAKFEL